MHLIPLTVTNPGDEANPDLPLKLQAEWPRILASAVRGRLSADKTINSRSVSFAYFNGRLSTKNTSAPGCPPRNRAPQRQTHPLILDSEISGIVERVDPDAANLVAGDEVFGATNPSFINGYAEYTIAVARIVKRRPASLSENT